MRHAAAALFCWALRGVAIAEPNPFPEVAAAYLVQIGERDLWAADADKRLAPASLTKIMTALLVLEDYRPRETVTVSGAAARETGARLGLRRGERLPVEALLAGTLVGSANDACHALAEHYAATVADFVERMNRRAVALGLTNTRFANPCGFDAPDHFSSVRDLARLTHAALAHPEFAAAVAKPEVRLVSTDGKRIYRVRNKNALIGNYTPAIGVKTGYTSNAGKCLIVLAEKNGARVLLTMLGARERWWDAIGILEQAFDAAADVAR
ncbi:MAG: D-alanyl-D-alanine carboxypeptidase family protein [Betaproteobacteria bacterium]